MNLIDFLRNKTGFMPCDPDKVCISVRLLNVFFRDMYKYKKLFTENTPVDSLKYIPDKDLLQLKGMGEKTLVEYHSIFDNLDVDTL